MATILYVEDDDGLRATICQVLSDWGHTVYGASTPADALESFGNDIDVVITEYDFSWRSSITGVGLAVSLSRISPNTPVVIFSGLDRTQECIEAGVECHVIDKSDFGGLQEIIEAVAS